MTKNVLMTDRATWSWNECLRIIHRHPARRESFLRWIRTNDHEARDIDLVPTYVMEILKGRVRP